jgi:hypothetical protein
MVLRDRRADIEEKKQGHFGGSALEINGSTAEPISEKSGTRNGNESKT